MITGVQLRQMREAFHGLSGLLAIQKKMCVIALDRLAEAERQRDELEAACTALATAIHAAEDAGVVEFSEHESATKRPAADSVADSRNSSHSMVGELGGDVPDKPEKGKRTSRNGGKR